MGALVDGLSPESRSDLTFLEDAKLKFRDSDIYIHSPVDGKIKAVADSSEIDAIELSGKTSLTGATTITGNVDITGDASLQLSTKDGSTTLIVKDSDKFPIFKVDSKGNLKTKGVVSKI